MRFIRTFFSLLVLAPVGLFAEEMASRLDEYNGRLSLDIPYGTILSTEVFHVDMRLENNGADILKVIANGLNDGYQLVWIPCVNGAPVERSGWVLGEHYSESPTELFSDQNLTTFDTVELNPGRVYEADHVRVSSLSWNLPQGQAEAEFRPALYGGEGRVIYGEPFKIKYIPKPPKSFKKVFASTFTAGGDAAIPFEVYEVPIEGETYLFNNTGVRFCRIPPGVKYSVAFRQVDDPLEYLTTVAFEDAALKPHIFSWRHYELVSAPRETVPWLFDKPRTDGTGAKHRKPQGANDSTTDGERAPHPERQTASVEPRNGLDSASNASAQLPLWIWVVGGCVLAASVALLILPAKKKG